jgi:formiminotetrahydrofolate cyclodeaminase
MVCGLSLKRPSFAAHHDRLREARERLADLRRRLHENVDRDAASYNGVMAAFKLPKSSESERTERTEAIAGASRVATEVPLETAELSAEVARIVSSLRDISIPLAASDLGVALELAATARRAALENVRANLPSITDRDYVEGVERKMRGIG